MLAKKYNGESPAGFWMSEKLDGVRAIWTGGGFVSRSGKAFSAPEEMIAAMPAGVVLDGEVFGGRGQFQKTVGRVRKGDWEGLEYVVFDCVSDAGFEERQQLLNSLVLPAFCRVLEQELCTSKEGLNRFERSVLHAGGEGVMLRAAGSLYEGRRSSALLKVKRFHDAEARVIGYESGNGKNAGRLGALIVEALGVTFKVGSGLTDLEREAPPAIGAKITFSFFELTDGGIPRFPAFVGVRNYE